MGYPTFTLQVPSLSASTLSAIGFEGEEALSSLYRYKIRVAVPSALDTDLQQILGREAQFIMRQDKVDYVVPGLIDGLEIGPSAGARQYLQITLVPRVQPLTRNRASRVFSGEQNTYPPIIEELLRGGGFRNGRDYDVSDVHGRVCTHDQTWQYDESDWHFISRLLEFEGLYYYFDFSDPEPGKLCISDTVSNYPPLGIDRVEFSEAGGESGFSAVKRVMRCLKSIVDQVEVYGYNYLKPALSISARFPREVSRPSPTVLSLGRENLYTPDDAERIAQLRYEALVCHSDTYRGESGLCMLRPGYTFRLGGHPDEQFNRRYLVTSVSHRGRNLDREWAPVGEASPEGSYYRNSFTAIAETTKYRPLRRTPWPRVEGLIHGYVAGGKLTNESRAPLDEYGRYRVRLSFDRSEATKYYTTAWIRKAHSYAGLGEGTFHWLAPGVEVLLGFEDGMIDRPLITAALYNGDTGYLVTSKKTFC